MSARLSTESESVHLGIRVPRTVLEALDAEVTRLEARVPPALRGTSRITRSSVARALIRRDLEGRDLGPELTWGECLEVPGV